MEAQIRARRWTLIVASETYQRRAEGLEDPAIGQGAKWESGVIRRDLYQSGGLNEKFVPVGFGSSARAYVPSFLSDYTFFDVDSDEEYVKLLSLLTGRPLVIPEPVGAIHPLTANELTDVQPQPRNSDEIASAYAAEDKGDAEFFRGLLFIPDYIGIFGMTVRPAVHMDRIQRSELSNALRSMHASYAIRSNVPDIVPFNPNAPSDGFASGAGRQMVLNEPQWKRCEGVRLHPSGQYSIRRVFEEDYSDEGKLDKYSDWELWLEYFIFRVSLFFLLARNVCRALQLGPKELLECKFKVSGLRNRAVVPFDYHPAPGVALLVCESRPGTTPYYEKHVLTSLDDFEDNVLNHARSAITDILYNFNLEGTRLEQWVRKVQRDLVGSSEPAALPNITP